jgi:hypothetical protein
MQTYINSDIAQLRPAHGMVQVVLAEVVLGQIGNVGELNMRDVAWAEEADIHLLFLKPRLALSDADLNVSCTDVLWLS